MTKFVIKPYHEEAHVKSRLIWDLKVTWLSENAIAAPFQQGLLSPNLDTS